LFRSARGASALLASTGGRVALLFGPWRAFPRREKGKKEKAFPVRKVLAPLQGRSRVAGAVQATLAAVTGSAALFGLFFFPFERGE
jgi:hypothetical protein